MENKNNHLKRIWLVLISALLIFSSVFAGCSDTSIAVSGKNSNTTSSESLSDLNYVSLNEGFTDVVVKDEKSALEAVASVADTLGIENVDKELKICDVNTVDGDSYYRFQQYYNDIPVYGKTVVVAADENGNATDLTSNITEVFDINGDYSSYDNVVVYSLNNNYYVCQYSLEQKDFETYINFTNVDTGKTIDSLCLTYTDDNIDYIKKEKNGSYSITDENRNLIILNANKKVMQKNYTLNSDNSVTRTLYTDKNSKNVRDILSIPFYIKNVKNDHVYNINDEIDFVVSNNRNNFDKSAITVINNVEKTYDYYLNILGRKGYDNHNSKMLIVYDDKISDGDNGNNAYSSATTLLSFGFAENYGHVDLIAHEFTHSVESTISSMTYSGESGAIMEGYSDVFGELAESYVNKSSPDWIHNDGRNIKAPNNSDNPASISDKEFGDTSASWDHGYVHNNSTVISHAAYLMWNGIDNDENKKIDVNKLAKIWYKALYLMQSDATFNQCADNVYRSAKRLKGVTKDQLSCVEEAFSKVGIEVNVDACDIIRVHNDSVINVFDTNSKEYGNYHLKIVDIPFYQNNSQKSSIVIDEDVDNSDGYQLTLNDGSYKITVTDNDTNGSQKEFSQIINVIGKYSKKQTQLEVVNVNIYTDFGHTELSDFTIPKDMTLTLGEIDVIEPETVPADATGYSIKWTSSDETVATVTPTGEECIVTSKGKGTATITGELVSNGKTITKSINVRVASQGRDTVLVLDVSGSMSGTPIDEMKKSAINFCNELLADEYNNRVGLVLYDDYIDSIDLTNDLDSLINYIEGISSGGTTNMQEALETAGNMLDSQGKADNIKNVVVMADGLPNEGETKDTGKMSQLTQYSSYSSDVAYANAVINTAENIMSNYNMYSLGFFHDLSGIEKDFAVDLMKLLTNMPDGYHQVDTAENLQFAFGDIQETISDGSKVVINIACPVDVSVTYNGETLSSAQSTYSDSASFGTLQLLGKNKDIKVLSLDPSVVYDVQLSGTGNGTMNYSVNYLDDSNAIIDYRTFESIPITPTTKIDSNTNNSAGEISLNLDEDGDGTVDKVYSAAVNSVAELTYGDELEEVEVVEETEPVESDNTWVTVMIAVVVVIVLLGIILTVVLVSSNSKKKNQTYNIPVIEPKNDTKNKDGKITVISGSMSGQEFNLETGKGYIIGKDSSKSQIVLAYDYGKVSREHCVISYDDQTQLYSVIDMSSNGTYYIDNKTAPLNSSVSKHRLNKNISMELQSGCVLILGDEDCRIVLN